LDVMKTALYHQLGKLPEPQFDHDYWWWKLLKLTIFYLIPKSSEANQVRT
jgi:hypothetical protein